MTTAILREELVEASVLRAITTELPTKAGVLIRANGYAGPPPHVVVREAFPTADERNSELLATTLAFGFSVDDGGEPGELGTTLTVFVHQLVCWVFGIEPRFARRVAYGIAHVARAYPDQLPDTLPLYDFNQDGDPQVDDLIVLRTQVQHQGNNSPRPWDRYVWTTTIEVRDAAYM